jgi:hypothetical protein
MIQRKVLVILAVIVALLTVATMGAVTSIGQIEGNVRSFVIDIAHSVPVEVSAPVELESGEVVTVTAPITINVELRVSVDGKGVVQVIEEAVQEPTITVSDTMTHEPSEIVEIGNLGWRISSQENLGAAFDWNSNVSYSTSGMFIRLGFALENQGDEPIKLNPYGEGAVIAYLVDERERQFAELDYGYSFGELCHYTEINPGLTESCVMVFEVPENVSSLTLRLSQDNETVEVPLTVLE